MNKKMKALELKKARLIELVGQGLPVAGNLSCVYLPCGKASCRCKRGVLHGPAWRITWKDQKKKSAILYVPREKLARVEAAVSDYQQAREMLKAIGRDNLVRLAEELRRK